MRITYLHQYFNTPEMSGGTRSFEMAKRLVAAGHHVTMITSCRESSEKQWFITNEAGIEVHWISVDYSNAMGFTRRVGAFLKYAIAAAQRAAKIPSDVVFATSTPLTIALPGVFAARRQHAPLVFEVRDLWPELPIAVGELKNPLLRLAALKLERFAYRNASHVIALSPGMAEGVAATGFPKQKISVIPNSADLEFFNPEKADADRFLAPRPELSSSPLVVYAGTLGRLNGVSYVARIAAATLELGAGIQFAVVGHGAEEEDLRDEAKRLGVLGVNFHMYPALPKREMPNVLAAADLALSTFINLREMWANSANKFFDALASGTAVAINYGGWQARLLEDTKSGFILPAEDPPAAAQLIVDAFAEPHNLGLMGRRARELAANRFDRDKLAEKLEAVLDEVLI